MLAISWKELPQKKIATIQKNGWVGLYNPHLHPIRNDG
jgi:hypothetical protein